MAFLRPVPLAEQNFPTSFGTSREREFFKYLPSLHPDGRVNHVETNTSIDFIPRSSSDPALTAFAQLGALRLDAQRVLISLFGRHEQHILAESTRSLSLQDDTDHISTDDLWVGSCTMSYGRSFCASVLHAPGYAQLLTGGLVLVPDLAQVAQLKDHQDVLRAPNIRCVVSSPITSPSGIVIGAYTLLDNKPRPSIDDTTVKFLMDMSTTVMNYLEVVRSRDQHLRSERMIVGIGSFLEGKGSLRNLWVEAVKSSGSPGGADDNTTEGNINSKQQEKQISDRVDEAMRNPGAFRNGRSTRPRLGRTSTQESAPLKKGGPKELLKPLSSPTARSHLKNEKGPMSKEDHRAQIEEVFSRAANLIRESIEIEASVFLDANFATRGAFVGDSKSDLENSSQEGYSSASGDDGIIRGAATMDGHSSTANVEDSGKGTTYPCRILGFSTSSASSVNHNSQDDNKIAVSEQFLASLLRRYPQGKIFNFFGDGSISASETSDGDFPNFMPPGDHRSAPGTKHHKQGRRYRRTRQAILRQDAESLLQIAPGARSIMFSPLWDSHKGRWYSANISWTQTSHRVLTHDDELGFMFAFGNSIMAELHRLDALFTHQVKSSLLAGLSHELRSPLHGIFGMTDLLNSGALNTLQRGFLHTISSCAFTLLGSIDQLLEYANIKDLRANSSSAQFAGGPTQDKLMKAGECLDRGQVDESSHVQLDVVLEEAIETVFAGYSFFNGLHFPLDDTHENGNFFGAGRFDVPGGVQVIFDVDATSNWLFSTRPGAWHVILTNLIGNALKFTQQGHIYISLRASPASVIPCKGDEDLMSKVVVIVRDSGCGMSPEFQQNGLFLPFSQEDSMSTGNGLGLNITQRIALSLGATIEIKSEKGVGTEVKLSVDLSNSPSGAAPASTNMSMNSAKELMRGKTIGLLGFSSSKVDQILCSSLTTLFQGWFQMNVQQNPSFQPGSADCDIYVSPFQFIRDNKLNIDPGDHKNEHISSPVIIMCPSPRITHSMFVESRKQYHVDIFEFISQPCGPRKLAKAFEACSKRQRQRTEISGSGPKDNPPMVLSTPSMDWNQRILDQSLSIEDLDPSSGNQSTAKETRGIATRSGRESDASFDQMQPGFDVQNTCAALNANLPGAQGAIDQTSTPGNESEPPGPLESSAKTILLVDDNHINLRILVEFMKKLGCKYQTASNGQEALETFKANSSSISVIFMDISMPVMDGLESSRRIREHEKKLQSQQTVYIIALTGVAQDDLQRDTIGSGMDAFLTKPARIERLIPFIQGRGIETRDLTRGSNKATK